MFQSLPESVRLELARILLVILAVCIIWMVRSLVTRLLARPLRRLLERLRLPGVEAIISQIIAVPTTYLLLALAIDLGARFLDLNSDLLGFISHLSRTLIIVAIALLVYRLIDVLVFSRRQVFILTGLTLDEALVPFVRTGTQLIVVVLGLVIIVQEWGYDITGLIAGLGLGGLAISLAAQDTLTNLFGFAAIVSDRPFVVGEYIKTPDVEGLIERVGLRSTRVRQIDQAVVAVPNKLLAASPVLNWSRLSRRKVELTLGVSYRTTPDEMETLLKRLREVLKAHNKVDPNSVIVYFVGFGPSALNILVRCYLAIADWGEFTAEQERILLEIMRVVEALHLQIAFPSQSLYIETMTNGVLKSDSKDRE